MMTKTTILRAGDRLRAQLDSKIILKFYVEKHGGSVNGLLIKDLYSREIVGAVFEIPLTVENVLAKHPHWEEIIRNGSLEWD